VKFIFVRVLTMTDFVAITEAAETIGRRPRDLSDIFYRRPPGLDLSKCPKIGTRRVILRSYLPALKKLLEERELVTA
jgi:hypothetical protein